MQQTQNYYEVLQVDQTAGMNEIEEAYRREYNKWSKLINHHDPDMQDSARKNLRLIEAAKTTLLDASKRSEHDSALASGLYDESAKPNLTAVAGMPVMTPPPPQKSSKKESPTLKNAWECTDCDTVNSPGTMYCISCGTQLGKNCPECGHTLPVSAEFCTNCGVNFQQREWEIEQDQIAAEKAARQQMQNYFQYVRSIPMHRHKKVREELEAHPEYSQTSEAINLYEAAKQEGSKWTWTLIGISAAISAFAGLVLGSTGRNPDGGSGLLFGAVLGAIGGAIFGHWWGGKWGGESGQPLDAILAVLTGPFLLVFGIFILVIVGFVMFAAGG
ncbi:MAG: hypothetical protein CL607_04410 [Anaerolineaceae bacterium]|nr:hypothetical protein [Anaerolineaceae bacterium]